MTLSKTDLDHYFLLLKEQEKIHALNFEQLCLVFDRMKHIASWHGRELRYVGQKVLPLLKARIKQHIEDKQLTFDF